MITIQTAKSDEIQNVVNLLEPTLEHFPKATAIMACIAVAIISMYPDITSKQLQEGIKGVGDWICLYVDSLTSKDNQKVN